MTGQPQTRHSVKSAWEADLARYGTRPWLREQSIYAIAVYRFGQMGASTAGWRGRMMRKAYWPLYRVVETITGITLPRDAVIGPGLRIHHFGPIVIHGGVQIGSNCTLRHGVTIGNRREGGPLPKIGDSVEFGAYAQVLGGVEVGDTAKIGALSVVLADVPPGATAVGAPARIASA